jgi:hypothetical protein
MISTGDQKKLRRRVRLPRAECPKTLQIRTVYCPATDLKQNGPTSFQVFVQAVFDNGQKGGRVLIAEVDWQCSTSRQN